MQILRPRNRGCGASRGSKGLGRYLISSASSGKWHPAGVESGKGGTLSDAVLLQRVTPALKHGVAEVIHQYTGMWIRENHPRHVPSARPRRDLHDQSIRSSHFGDEGVERVAPPVLLEMAFPVALDPTLLADALPKRSGFR